MKTKLSQLHRTYVLKSHRLNAEKELMWIIGYHLGVSAKDFILDDLSVDIAEYPNLRVDLEDYIEGKPLAYILKSIEFFGINLSLKEGVLIPRADTEPMVQYLIDHLKLNAQVLELGIGSGAISCALAAHRKDVYIDAIDNQKICVEVAQNNINYLGLTSQIQVKQDDWYQMKVNKRFDCIVSNPPYIDRNDPHVEKSVRQYEPENALFSSRKGLEDIEHIMTISSQVLKPRGMLVIEHGWQQQERIRELCHRFPIQLIHSGVDEHHHPRYTVFLNSE